MTMGSSWGIGRVASWPVHYQGKINFYMVWPQLQAQGFKLNENL
jgi:hypothetical protein